MKCSKVLLALTVTVAGLIALPGVGLGQDAMRKTFTIAVGHDWGPHEYIDTDGYVRGFVYDLITEVCEAANIECRTIWDKYTNCWNSDAGQHSYGGEGLMSGWYDACTGWTGAINRKQVFDFSMPFLENTKIYFYVRKADEASFDAYDVSKLKAIGFLDGWVSDEKCLARQTMVTGSTLEVSKIKHYETTDQIIKALEDREVDAIFSGEYGLFDNAAIVKVPTFFMCSATGNAMMTRKDNDFNDYWNVGFQQLVANGRFSKLCKEAEEKHGHIGTLTPCV